MKQKERFKVVCLSCLLCIIIKRGIIVWFYFYFPLKSEGRVHIIQKKKFHLTVSRTKDH